MPTAEMTRAVSTARSVATACGLRADDAVVLHNSNKVSVRLLPADVLVRVAPDEPGAAEFEVALAGLLAGAGCPVGALDPRVEPRVHRRDGFALTLWTHYEQVGDLSPAAYADALVRLHAGMRTVDLPTPHFTDRVEQARLLVSDRTRSPDLPEPERDLLRETLALTVGAIGDRIEERARRGEPLPHEQLLHGEPHAGNVLATADGPRFIDLETCCRGPVEFDLAHAPEPVAAHYPGADPVLLRQCRILVLAMITAWRWDRVDRLPDGRRLGAEWLAELRATLAHE
ncbi:aminoglycoside phosphotransferase family protein [Occultella glacieicola]|uniref:Aminoglycoside phosphotransferase family protein n=1 Tax=Occultella glacieicola TaxID=2518684 RepID=A0ABY2E5K7_9MICO|nr:phosphotransferase [Occultella glacieicola]TDE94899.1 aminoglycoside phosphotransferase family protein [Occultella glacieicola]